MVLQREDVNKKKKVVTPQKKQETTKKSNCCSTYVALVLLMLPICLMLSEVFICAFVPHNVSAVYGNRSTRMTKDGIEVSIDGMVILC